MRRSTTKDNDVVKFTVLLRNGTELELMGSRLDAREFHRTYCKWVSGQIHATNNHRLLCFEGHYIHAECVAAYAAMDFEGVHVDLDNIRRH